MLPKGVKERKGKELGKITTLRRTKREICSLLPHNPGHHHKQRRRTTNSGTLVLKALLGQTI